MFKNIVERYIRATVETEVRTEVNHRLDVLVRDRYSSSIQARVEQQLYKQIHTDFNDVAKEHREVFHDDLKKILDNKRIYETLAKNMRAMQIKGD